MIDSCANPNCRTELKNLNTGHLYAVETRSANTEFFWLCATCAVGLTMCLGLDGSTIVRPRSDGGNRRPPQRDNRLLLVSILGKHKSSYRDGRQQTRGDPIRGLSGNQVQPRSLRKRTDREKV